MIVMSYSTIFATSNSKRAEGYGLPQGIIALKYLRTLQPSQSFFTLLLTFIPLDCSTFLLRSISIVGLFQKLPIVLLKSSHENDLREVTEGWRWSIELGGTLERLGNRAVYRSEWRSNIALETGPVWSMAGMDGGCKAEGS